MSADPTPGPAKLAGDATDASTRSSRLIVIGFALVVVVVVGYFALGMPGMDMDDGATTIDQGSMDMDGMDMDGHVVDAAAFEARLTKPDAVVVNVHVPDEGSIEGTDLSIPFDQIVGDPALPRDRDRPILLYCRSGRMSQIAADALVAEGYTDVVQLEGGMDSWVATGRDLVPT